MDFQWVNIFELLLILFIFLSSKINSIHCMFFLHLFLFKCMFHCLNKILQNYKFYKMFHFKYTQMSSLSFTHEQILNILQIDNSYAMMGRQISFHHPLLFYKQYCKERETEIHREKANNGKSQQTPYCFSDNFHSTLLCI